MAADSEGRPVTAREPWLHVTRMSLPGKPAVDARGRSVEAIDTSWIPVERRLNHRHVRPACRLRRHVCPISANKDIASTCPHNVSKKCENFDAFPLHVDSADTFDAHDAAWRFNRHMHRKRRKIRNISTFIRVVSIQRTRIRNVTLQARSIDMTRQCVDRIDMCGYHVEIFQENRHIWSICRRDRPLSDPVPCFGPQSASGQRRLQKGFRRLTLVDEGLPPFIDQYEQLSGGLGVAQRAMMLPQRNVEFPA